jgi:hypothetical protein
VKAFSRFLVPAILVLLAAALYSPSLAYDFVNDDHGQIEMAKSRFTWDQLPSYFTEDVWAYTQRSSSNYYRPIFLVWLMLNHQAFGLAPAGWHASTVLVHAIATLLLYFLARRISGDAWLAAMGAAWFAVHPAHIESVAWVSGVTDPLLAVFFFGCLICYLRGQEGPPSRERFLWRAGAIALFALAIFAKETAVIVPVALLAAYWLFCGDRKDPASKRLRSGLLTLLPFLQVMVVYFGARVLALGKFVTASQPWPFRPIIYTLPSAILFYARELVWPTQTAMFHEVYAVGAFGFAAFVLPALSCLAIGVLLLWILTRQGALAFFAVLLVLPILPVLRISAFVPNDFVHDRYLYIPAAGFCLLIAAALRKLPVPALQAAAIVTIVAASAWITIRDEGAFQSEEALAAHNTKIAPNNPAAIDDNIQMLILTERYAEAEPLLTRRIAAEPTIEALYYGRAVCYTKLARWTDAKRDLEKVLEWEPNYPHAHLLLGMVESELLEYDAAEAEMRKAIAVRPHVSAQYSGYHETLAQLLERRGNLPGAIAEYENEFQENPDNQGAYERAAALRLKLRN